MEKDLVSIIMPSYNCGEYVEKAIRSVQTIAKVFSPFKYDNDTRCDLHPRWSRDGRKVCFDSVFVGHRGLYVVNVK